MDGKIFTEIIAIMNLNQGNTNKHVHSQIIYIYMLLAPPGAARRMPGTAPALPKERVTATATETVKAATAVAAVTLARAAEGLEVVARAAGDSAAARAAAGWMSQRGQATFVCPQDPAPSRKFEHRPPTWDLRG